MDRNRARNVSLAVLAAVAVALTAAAAAPMFATDQGSENRPQPPASDTSVPNSGGSDIEMPTQMVVLVVIAVGLLGLLVQFARDPWETFKGILKLAAYAAVFVAIMAIIAENVTLSPFSPNESAGVSAGNLSGTPTEAGDGFGEGGNDPLVLPIEHSALIAFVAAVVGVVTLYAWRSDTVRSVLALRDDAEDDDPDVDLDEVREVAGEAADRVDAAATATVADNAIYTTWSEMVALLDVSDPQSGTPRQFARAATEAGMDPDDVTVLTRAFEDVRYGDAELSEDRREQVAAAFRRIETAHDDDANDAQWDGAYDDGGFDDGPEDIA